MMSALTLFLALTFWPSFGMGATPPPESLTLEVALREAPDGSPELKRAKALADAASWRTWEALSAHLPQLTASATHFFDAKYQRSHIRLGGNEVVIPGGYPQTQATLEASWMLFDGLASWNRYQAARMASQAESLQFSRSRFLLEQEIREKFYQALASKVLVEVADQNIRSLEEHLALETARARAGTATQVDSLRVDAQLEEAGAEKLLAIDNFEIARNDLRRAMGQEEDQREPVGELPEPQDREVQSGLSLDLGQREDLEAQARRESAADRAATASALFWVPKLAVFAQKSWYKFGNFDPAILPTASYEDAYAVGLRLSWNLFDGGASFARAKEAASLGEAERQKSRFASLQAPDDFKTWKKRFLYNTALYQARQRNVRKSEESVRLSRAAVRAGTRTSSEFLDAELDLFRARAGLVRAQLDAAIARIRLELALGHRLGS